MRRLLRWLGILLGVLLLLIVLAGVVIFVRSEMYLNQTVNVQPQAITIPTDAAAVEHGRHLLVTIGGCDSCHGQNLGGTAFIDDPALGTFYAPNLTAGKGGIGSSFRDIDYVRAIRHGVKPDGEAILFMPVADYYKLSDTDLAAIIAYLKSLPPVDNETPGNKPGLLGRVLFATGSIPPPAAVTLDQTAPHPATPPPAGPNAAYGQYLVSVACMGCHGPTLSGGPIPGAQPGDPPALNLTPTGSFGNWSEADFIQTLRSGVRPGGSQLNDAMPWQNFSQMTDDELKAVWAYLKTVPPKPFGNR
ncbi:MAG: c-type cytochrome [Chloroflexi bacterium]|nr:c-type cytochrome [Chloroflexota bacterium]